jgi:hypothetical protein
LRLDRFVKLLEIAIMPVAAIGWVAHNLWLLVASGPAWDCIRHYLGRSNMLRRAPLKGRDFPMSLHGYIGILVNFRQLLTVKAFCSFQLLAYPVLILGVK